MCEQFDFSELNALSFIVSLHIENRLKSIKILEDNGFSADFETQMLERDRALIEKINQLKSAAALIF